MATIATPRDTTEATINPNTYDLILPGLKLALQNLSSILSKASAHIKDNGLSESEFTSDARLAPDMFALPRQVHSACNTVKFLMVRFAGLADTLIYPDSPTSSIAELQERIAATLEYMNSATREQFNDPEFLSGEKGEVKAGGGRFVFGTGLEYVSCFVVPNFYFHCAMVYAILRSKGVEIGKLDWLAGGIEEFGGRTGERLRKFDW